MKCKKIIDVEFSNSGIPPHDCKTTLLSAISQEAPGYRRDDLGNLISDHMAFVVEHNLSLSSLNQYLESYEMVMLFRYSPLQMLHQLMHISCHGEAFEKDVVFSGKRLVPIFIPANANPADIKVTANDIEFSCNVVGSAIATIATTLYKQYQ